MTALLVLIPWAVVAISLLFIMSKKNDKDYEDSQFAEDDVVRVAIYKDKAYWVYQNVFYESEIVWEPDFTTAQPIDTMSLSPKEINELLIILDELKEQEKG